MTEDADWPVVLIDKLLVRHQASSAFVRSVCCLYLRAKRRQTRGANLLRSREMSPRAALGKGITSSWHISKEGCTPVEHYVAKLLAVRL
jgi:hypothetical protein